MGFSSVLRTGIFWTLSGSACWFALPWQAIGWSLDRPEKRWFAGTRSRLQTAGWRCATCTIFLAISSFSSSQSALSQERFVEAPDLQGPPEVWRELWDGQSMAPWRSQGQADAFMARSPLLIGNWTGGREDAILVHQNSVGDGELFLEFRLNGNNLNAGILIGKPAPNSQSEPWQGIQVECDGSQRQWTGALYDMTNGKWLQTLEKNPAARAAFQASQWNALRVRWEKERIQTWINGIPAADIQSSALVGPLQIALQIHPTDASRQGQWQVRLFRFRPLGLP
ncbi:MAG: DUF1080 domain-containing protein [Pirellulaceae bacterium]